MENIIFIEFLLLSFIGLTYHFYEKKYLHLTTECSFIHYLIKEKAATYKALSAIITSCYFLALAHTDGYYPTLSELGGTLAFGYAFDNALNKAPDNDTN